MELALSLTVGVLFATGSYLVMQQTLLRRIAGATLLSHGVHVLLLTMGGVKTGALPIIQDDGPLIDPLPQALILTSIVISFGLTAFLLVFGVLSSKKTEGESSHER